MTTGDVKIPYQTRTFLPVQHDEEAVSTLRNLVILRNQVVSLVQINAHHRMLGCKELINGEALATSLFLRFVFEKEPLLQLAEANIEVISNSRLFTLIPSAFAQPPFIGKYASVLLDDAVFEDEWYTDPIPELEAESLFVSPPFVRHILDEYLSSYTLKHVSAPLVRLGQQLMKWEASHLWVYIWEGLALVGVCKEGRILMCNAYEYQVPSGLMYFIQSLLTYWNLDIYTLPVYLLGDLENDPAMYTYLSSRLPGLREPAILKAYLPESPDETMYFRYGFLVL